MGIFFNGVTMKLRRAIFRRYNGDWGKIEGELEAIAQRSGTAKGDISLYMKGLNDSLYIEAKLCVCQYLGLDPEDFPELAFRIRTE